MGPGPFIRSTVEMEDECFQVGERISACHHQGKSHFGCWEGDRADGALPSQFSSIITKYQRQPTYKERSSQSVGLRVYGRAVHNGGNW